VTRTRRPNLAERVRNAQQLRVTWSHTTTTGKGHQNQPLDPLQLPFPRVNLGSSTNGNAPAPVRGGPATSTRLDAVDVNSRHAVPEWAEPRLAPLRSVRHPPPRVTCASGSLDAFIDTIIPIDPLPAPPFLARLTPTPFLARVSLPIVERLADEVVEPAVSGRTSWFEDARARGRGRCAEVGGRALGAARMSEPVSPWGFVVLRDTGGPPLRTPIATESARLVELVCAGETLSEAQPFELPPAGVIRRSRLTTPWLKLSGRRPARIAVWFD